MRESPKARQAWADYLALGPGRSLEKLLANYQSRTGSVPTRQLSRLKRWSADYDWQTRLQAIADQAADEAAELLKARRREALESGLALDFERVEVLKTLAERLLAELNDPHDSRLWVREPKWIGSGEFGREVEIARFNAREVEQLRGLLDDIAKEKAERAKTIKVDVETSVRELAARLGHDPDLAVALLQEVRRETTEGRRWRSS